MDEKHQMVYLVEIFGTHDVKVEHSNVLQAITGKMVWVGISTSINPSRNFAGKHLHLQTIVNQQPKLLKSENKSLSTYLFSVW